MVRNEKRTEIVRKPERGPYHSSKNNPHVIKGGENKSKNFVPKK